MLSARLSLLFIILILAPGAGLCATVGQVDTFGGGLSGWFAGGGPMSQVPPAPPEVIADGGPGGTGDAYLRITSNGSSGPGGRLVAMNASQWAGNYTLAGINQISMDLINLGTTDLVIRLYLEDPIPGPPQNEAMTEGFTLQAGSGWQRASFSLFPADLNLLNGSIDAVLSNTTILRLLHSPIPTFPPDQITGVLGVDNITAEQIPEPATLLMTAAGGVAILVNRRRRK